MRDKDHPVIMKIPTFKYSGCRLRDMDLALETARVRRHGHRLQGWTRGHWLGAMPKNALGIGTDF